MLHHPFRDVDALRYRHGEQLTWQELPAECSVSHTHQKDTLRDWEDENRVVQEDEDDDELMNPDVEDMEEAD
jgi:hypothetical protein